ALRRPADHADRGELRLRGRAHQTRSPDRERAFAPPRRGDRRVHAADGLADLRDRGLRRRHRLQGDDRQAIRGAPLPQGAHDRRGPRRRDRRDRQRHPALPRPRAGAQGRAGGRAHGLRRQVGHPPLAHRHHPRGLHALRGGGGTRARHHGRLPQGRPGAGARRDRLRRRDGGRGHAARGVEEDRRGPARRDPGRKRSDRRRRPRMKKRGSGPSAQEHPPGKADPYRTRSGLPLEPHYGPEHLRSHPPPPGTFPYTRGIHPDMYRGKVWTMRQYAGFGTPSQTNERFRFLLQEGQTGLSLALDLPTQLGLDSDDPLALGEVGKVGVAIDSLADMETIFEGIPLERVSTSMTINGTAPILLAMYEVAARKQGVPPERIAGTVQNDPLKEIGARGAWIFPVDPSMRLAMDLVEHTLSRLPRFNPSSIASHYRDAGANPAEEMAYTLSAGIAYARALLARGVSPDDFGARFSFFFYTYTNFFEEVAKYRAGRRIWARWMKDAGATKENAMRMRA